ncbi:MAG TPA: hypothetical protein VH369_23005 [Bryobacteraceae bacterium]|jgi:hypothetical protein
MTPRSIRRAAERKARKLARKAAREQQQLSPEPPQTEITHEIFPVRLEANRANALLSTGPRTTEGKRTCSLNAVKTGLTGVTVLLPTDDAAEYQRHIAAYQEEFQPVGLEESDLVQSLADIAWRLRRIPALEMAIYARGRVEFADLFEDEKDPGVRRSLIELHTHITYEKQLRNLQLQEARLVRRREKETAELRRLQGEREQKERQAQETGAKQKPKLFHAPERTGRLVPVVRVQEENGFEFSNLEIEDQPDRVSASGSSCRPSFTEVKLEIAA